MRRIRIAALCLSAAMALSVFATGCSFFQGESADSASASSSSAAEGEPSLLKPASEYEYENFSTRTSITAPVWMKTACGKGSPLWTM